MDDGVDEGDLFDDIDVEQFENGTLSVASTPANTKRFQPDDTFKSVAGTPHSIVSEDDEFPIINIDPRPLHTGKMGPHNPSFPPQSLPSEKKKPTAQPLENQRDLNGFEETLLRLKGNRGPCSRISDVDAQKEAESIINDMVKAQKQDEEARRSNFPSLAKVLILKSIVGRIMREKIGEYFVYGGGVLAIMEWISPTPGVPLKISLPAPEIVESMVKVLLAMPISRAVLLDTKIGVMINNIWKNAKYTYSIRRLAEKLCLKWLALIQKSHEETEEGPEFEEPCTKRSKFDSTPRRQGSQPTFEPDPDEVTVFPPKLASRRNPEFFHDKDKTAQLIEEGLNRRHAMRPMDKPAFHGEHLPNDYDVMSKVGWDKTNPATIMGKIDRRIEFMRNPNKKAWKNSIARPVSIGGKEMGQAPS